MNLVMAFIGCFFLFLFSLFAQFKTTTKSHENYIFLYPFSSMAISPQNNEKKKTVLYTGKLYGLTGMKVLSCFFPFNLIVCHSESDDVAKNAPIYEA